MSDLLGPWIFASPSSPGCRLPPGFSKSATATKRPGVSDGRRACVGRSRLGRGSDRNDRAAEDLERAPAELHRNRRPDREVGQKALRNRKRCRQLPRVPDGSECGSRRDPPADEILRACRQEAPVHRARHGEPRRARRVAGEAGGGRSFLPLGPIDVPDVPGPEAACCLVCGSRAAGRKGCEIGARRRSSRSGRGAVPPGGGRLRARRPPGRPRPPGLPPSKTRRARGCSRWRSSAGPRERRGGGRGRRRRQGGGSGLAAT